MRPDVKTKLTKTIQTKLKKLVKKKTNRFRQKLIVKKTKTKTITSMTNLFHDKLLP